MNFTSLFLQTTLNKIGLGVAVLSADADAIAELALPEPTVRTLKRYYHDLLEVGNLGEQHPCLPLHEIYSKTVLRPSYGMCVTLSTKCKRCASHITGRSATNCKCEGQTFSKQLIHKLWSAYGSSAASLGATVRVSVDS